MTLGFIMNRGISKWSSFVNERIDRLRAHQKNIERYQALLKTKLSDVEQRFLEKRLSEEHFAVANLLQNILSA